MRSDTLEERTKINSATPLARSAALNHFRAGDILHTDNYWKDDQPIIVETFRRLIVWEPDLGKNAQMLGQSEFVEFYNNYLHPLRRFVYGSNACGNPSIQEDGDWVVKNKKDFIDLVWLLSRCLNIEGLRTGIRVRTRKESVYTNNK